MQLQNTISQYDLEMSGFYKKTLEERLQQIKNQYQDIQVQNFETGGLSLSHAQLMIENCIGKLSLPLGLGVPMAVEEPSIIAAASSAAKFISQNGGFTTYSTNSIMIGQIQILDCEIQKSAILIQNNKNKLIDLGNQKCQAMVQRGGGIIDIKTKVLEPFDFNIKLCHGELLNPMLIVEVFIDVCESMGANLVNTICEFLSEPIEKLIKARSGLKILSNLCTERKAVAYFEIPVISMGWKQSTGEEVAYKILEAYRFAQMDPYRASTHNKGILNGIDAVAIATGQDWRAIEAAAHSYASINKYKPLTQYEIIKRNNLLYFKAVLELPIAVGTKGGVLQSNSVYENSMRILDYPSSSQLSEIMCCVGLAQNFAALRAMVVQGIQKGHMALHSKNIAIAAGVPTHLVEEAAKYMTIRGKITQDMAYSYMKAHDVFQVTRQRKLSKDYPLSTFFVSFKPRTFDEQIVLHLLFDCFSDEPIHLSIEKQIPQSRKQFSEINEKLFGAKEFEWLTNIFNALENLQCQPKNQNQQKMVFQLKLLCILINLLAFSLSRINYEKTKFLFKNIQAEINAGQLFESKEILQNEPLHLKYGITLFCELFRLFKYRIKEIQNKNLRNQLILEMYNVVEAEIECLIVWQQAKSGLYNLENFFNLRKKRLCVTLMFLCDLIPFFNLEEKQIDIQIIKQFGDYYESKGTQIHDLVKWQKDQDHNYYCYWLLNKNQYLSGNDPIIQKQYLDEVNLQLKCEKYLEQKMNAMKKIMPEELKDAMKVNDKLIQDYYNQQKFLQPFKAKL